MNDRRMNDRIIYAVVPVKDTQHAKQRLAAVLSRAQRRELVLAMLEDVLAALAAVGELAGIVVVTADPAAAAVGARYRARIQRAGAGDGHTGAVAAAARELAGDGMLALPADIPLVEPDDIRRLILADRNDGHRRVFSITPARDERGSNAVLCSPAGAVPLRFGEDSFFPHLAAARSCGIEPAVVRLPRIALDIDTPDDLALFLRAPSPTRAYALARRWGIDLNEGTRVSA
jgi:2-phospho-L-lactate guanylyltransferase